ncbi:MFS transporter [Virgisporangium ochraceum]|uniref:MFS transporter n=1 Tax=Virgisporangium ochraceum TaxID=65505 RepID=A0A8J3ZK96_9ACTN|nr:MFS transporter [Virgisporangium ochraceum]GIJ65296.1 MFS transporter [Virgisporangium ochraceum]
MASLFRERDFRLLFAGQGISAVGTAVTYVALPLIAVAYLGAGPFEVSLITAAGYAAWLVLSLPFGVFVDRRQRRPLLIVTDLGRAALLATVPAAALADALTVPHLIVVALLAGALSVLFDVAYPAYIPVVVADRSRLTDANGKLFATESAAHVGGPGLGGLLLQAVGAAGAVVVDVVSFLVSAFTLTLIRSPEPPVSPKGGSVRAELVEGLRYTFGRPFTRAVLGAGVIGNFVFGGYNAVVVVFLYETVGLTEAAVGVLLGVGAAGAVAGALVTGWLGDRIGDARLTWLAPAAGVAFGALVPLAAGDWRLVLFALGAFGLSAEIGIYNVCVRAALQTSVPGDLLGRTMASIRLFTRGMLPLGALAAGALATVTSPRVAIAVMMALLVLCPLWLRRSPVGRVRTLAELGADKALGPRERRERHQ